MIINTTRNLPMKTLKDEFLIGFHEGWFIFWSPFVGFARAVSAVWKAHRQQS
jgi:hypothetical protein